ncbi:hypothetical protein ES703_40743 [subsurface metagenome]
MNNSEAQAVLRKHFLPGIPSEDKQILKATAYAIFILAGQTAEQIRVADSIWAEASPQDEAIIVDS